jgi:hypothetical protein
MAENVANATSKVPGLHVQTLGTRLTWIALGVGAVAVLALARALTPSPSGLGTHTQLGLPPCGFLWLTGLPCPGCGLTTSFAHLTRFEWELGVAANPLGLPLFLLSVACIPLCALGAGRAWPVINTFQRLRADIALYGLACAGALSWVSRLLGIWLA